MMLIKINVKWKEACGIFFKIASFMLRLLRTCQKSGAETDPDVVALT